MSADTGEGFSDCIVITNRTKKSIKIDATDGGVRKTLTVDPRDSYVIFTNKIETISWERSK